MLSRKRKQGLEVGTDRRAGPRQTQALAVPLPVWRPDLAKYRPCLLLVSSEAALTSSPRLVGDHWAQNWEWPGLKWNERDKPQGLEIDPDCSGEIRREERQRLPRAPPPSSTEAVYSSTVTYGSHATCPRPVPSPFFWFPFCRQAHPTLPSSTPQPGGAI